MLTLPRILSTYFSSPFSITLKSTNGNWYRLFSCFPHSGDLHFQVFILKEFLDYLNGYASVRWDCHIYDLAFLIRVISDIWFISRYFPISINWHSTEPLLVRSLRQFLVCARTICLLS